MVKGVARWSRKTVIVKNSDTCLRRRSGRQPADLPRTCPGSLDLCVSRRRAEGHSVIRRGVGFLYISLPPPNECRGDLAGGDGENRVLVVRRAYRKPCRNNRLTGATLQGGGARGAAKPRPAKCRIFL